MANNPSENFDIYERKAFMAIAGLLDAYPVTSEDNILINFNGLTLGDIIVSNLLGGVVGGLIGSIRPAHRVYIHPKKKKEKNLSEEIQCEVHNALVDYFKNNNPNIRDLEELQGLLLLIIEKLDSIANSIGATNQRTSREIIETNDLINKLSDLIQKSSNTSDDIKIVKLYKSLSMEVVVALVSDYLKTIITSMSH
ncbi:MAG: hypothetical protein K0R50_3022 [Eubacterium sp.]|jgi:CRISPR/Cas system CSM-associated protein Csm2 small subunit|nr:hypothetical protein [Eubacterium sp.]